MLNMSKNTKKQGTTVLSGSSKKRLGANPSAQLKYSPEQYRVRELSKMDIADVRKEYSRLRSIARKRLQRIEGTPFEQSQSYKNNKDKYKPLKDISDTRELYHLLYDLSIFIRSRNSSLKSLKTQMDSYIETMNERYPELNLDENNYFEFVEFMASIRRSALDKIYDSQQVLEYFESLKARGLSVTGKDLYSSFLKWKSNKAYSARKRRRNPAGNRQSAAEARRLRREVKRNGR